MNKNRKPLRRLSPVQLLLIGLIVIAAALYQAYDAGPGQPVQTDAETSTPASAGTSTMVTGIQTPNLLSTATSQGKDGKATLTVTPLPSLPAETMSHFDYFILALSWSPDYCATSGGNDAQQCSLGKKLGFVLHGLWPQNNQGYPVNCTTEKMPQSVKNQFVGLYPNDALFDHEWEKHGTCTGLTPTHFLTLSRQVMNSLVIPAAYRSPETPFRTTTQQLRNEFTQANPSINPAAFETNCSGSGRYFKELYVCFSRTGSPIACGAEVHKEALKSCQAADFTVRNLR